MINQYIIAAAIWIASLIGVGFWQHSAGVDSQKVADQAQFDQINADIAQQKSEANDKYRKAYDNNMLVMIERDEFKTKLLKERQANAENINAIRNSYSNVSLRYAVKDSGLGQSCGNSLPAKTDAASNASSVERELPAAITASLRSIAYDCDALNADYRLLYDWANQAAINSASK